MESKRNAAILMAGAQGGESSRIARMLTGAGYRVTAAATAEQALAHANTQALELALLDMPGADGIALCKRLHDLPRQVDLPVMFVAGARDRALLIDAFDAGAVDYVTPPFHDEELLVRVRNQLNLKRARDRLAAMLRERREVTEVVAHDIKNPLTSILFGAQLLLGSKETPIPRAEVTRDIKTCAEEALRLIQRFLTRSAEGQRLREFSAEPLSLASVAREAIQLQQPAAEARGVRMALAGDASASADRRAVRNVLQNLLSTAIQSSPEGSRIEIEIGAARPGFSHCRVLDRGAGVSEEQRGKLFKRYVNFAAARERGSEPADFPHGFGLAIAKHDVAEMGGHLWHEPRPGGGSVFGFDLPQQPPAERLQ